MSETRKQALELFPMKMALRRFEYENHAGRTKLTIEAKTRFSIHADYDIRLGIAGLCWHKRRIATSIKKERTIHRLSLQKIFRKLNDDRAFNR